MALDAWDTWSYDTADTGSVASAVTSSGGGFDWNGLVQGAGKGLVTGLGQYAQTKANNATELEKLKLTQVANGVAYNEGQRAQQLQQQSNTSTLMIIGGLVLAVIVLRKLM
jgi:hypothetical protein